MNVRRSMSKLSLLILLWTVSACTSAPENVTPVSNFNLNQYLGQWYEIARLDHSFERGLEQVSAHYSMRDDGGVNVINRGYSNQKKQWDEAIGKAYFVSDSETGHLKVSFFGPFYGAYVIFELDEADYQYAFVSGPNLNYLWLLARTPIISNEIKQDFIEKSAKLGFDTEQLIWPQPAQSIPGR